jgi:hypothetical protein
MKYDSESGVYKHRMGKGDHAFSICRSETARLFRVGLSTAKEVRVDLYLGRVEGARELHLKRCSLGCCLQFYVPSGAHLIAISTRYHDQWPAAQKLYGLVKDGLTVVYATIETR